MLIYWRVNSNEIHAILLIALENHIYIYIYIAVLLRMCYIYTYIYPLAVISLRQTMGPSLVGRAVDCQADGFPVFSENG